MTQNKDQNNLYGYGMSTFLPLSGFKWIDPKELDFKNYTSNSSNECVLKSDKIETKREMLSG